jgi:hypothetical protein
MREAHPAVVEFLDGGKLAPWREREALAAWQQARQRARAGMDRPGWFALTQLLAQAARDAGDGMRERALLETGYELSAEPRHRTWFAARLAMGAVRAGDVPSAQSWLGRGDAGTDDLEAYSALRLAAALLAHYQSRPEQVLQELGAPNQEVPLCPADEALAAVLRAWALERFGHQDQATAVLEAAVERRWPKSRAEVAESASMMGDCCPASLQALNERRGKKARAGTIYNLVVLSVFILLWGGGGVFGLVQVLRGESLGWMGAAGAGFLAAAGLLWGVAHTVRKRNAWRAPEWATVRTTLPGDGDTHPIAEMVLDSDPRTLHRLSFNSPDVVVPGMRALVVRDGTTLEWLW